METVFSCFQVFYLVSYRVENLEKLLFLPGRQPRGYQVFYLVEKQVFYLASTLVSYLVRWIIPTEVFYLVFYQVENLVLRNQEDSNRWFYLVFHLVFYLVSY